MTTVPKGHVFQPKLVHKPPFSVEVPGVEAVKGETIPRRHPIAVNGLRETPEEGVATIYDVVRRSSQKYGNAKAMGTRDVVKVHTETKNVTKIVDGQKQEVEKKWSFFELSEYKYLSFTDYELLTLQIGSGFRALNMGKGDRVHIFAGTRYDE
jgi:long-chain acyl-CoA synthetase